jgi:DNA modification methylase
MTLNNPLENEEVQTISLRELVKDIPSTNYATHGVYYYPAKFIPHVVRFAISEYTKKGDLIFDPFAGSGTAAVEAAILGRKSLLWDIDPILEYLIKVKLLKVKKEDWEDLKDNIKSMLSYNEESFVPNWKNKLHWYDKPILERLERLWGYIHYALTNDYRLKPIIIFALLKASRKFSYGDDRVPKLFKSKMKTKCIGKLLKGDWESYLYDFLFARAKDIFNRCLKFTRLVGEKEIFCKVEIGDALKMKAPQDITLIVTSPPYFQAQEYIRSTKLELYWLGYTDKQIREFSKAEIPYNNPPNIEIRSPSFNLFRECIKLKRRDLLWIYDNWFYSVIKVLEKSFNALKENGHMVTFIGPSTIAGMPVPIYKVIKEHFEERGAVHIKTIKDEIQTRRLFGNRLNPSPEGIPAEYLTILRKS